MIDIYKKRREKLINEIKDHSMVLLFSGEHLIATSDQNYPFIINKNFFYLTGLDVSEATLLLVKIDQEIYEYLFIEEFNELREKWTGKMLRPNEATEISGIRNILYSSQIDSKIDELIATKSSYGEVNHVYIDHKHKFLCASQTHEELVTYLKRKGKKGLEIIDVYPLLIRQRMVKDDHELELIKKSIKLTNNALKMVLDNLRPGLHEYQIRAMFEYVIRVKNAEIAFDTIVASGPNATILHHVDLSNRLRDGQLVLLDCGASIDKYKADISRTYPVNGVFNPLQKQIYEIVLAANKAVINFIRPGRTIAELQAFTQEFFKARLEEEKLLKEGEEVKQYYYHNVSHHLGLDTHDPALHDIPLEEGNVITVEPGLYFAKYGIGIRIEDDILVTKNGATNLSAEIKKEINEIETLIAKK